MAIGNELFLAVQGRAAIDTALSSLGLSYNWDEAPSDIEPEAKAESLQKLLVKAQKAALVELGFTILDPKNVQTGGKPVRIKDGYLYVQSPCKTKIAEMSTIDIAVVFDPDEMGDTEESAILGVNLIGRYFPVFLDWESPHGGSGDNIVFTPELLRQIEVARKHITGVFPFIKDAPIIVKELHY